MKIPGTSSFLRVGSAAVLWILVLPMPCWLGLARAGGSLDGGAEELALAGADGSGSLLIRDTLLDDWGGLRPALGEKGISWDLSFTSVFAGVIQGDVRDKDFDWGYRVDAFIRADTEKLGLWEDGGFHVHLESRFGEATERVVPRSGGLWPPNSAASFPLGDPERLVASSLYYQHRLGQQGALMIGKINALDLLANDPFFGGWGRDRFSNLAFVAPPSGVVPPVIMGGILNYRLEPVTYTLMVFDPDDRTNDYFPGDLFSDGVNVSLGAKWAGEIAGRASSLGVTATYSTQEGVDLRDLALPPGLVAGTKKGSYNVGVSVSHLLWESLVLPGKGLGLYARAAVADGNPNPINSSYVGGLSAHGLVPARPDDVFGLGLYHYDFSDDLRLGAAPLVEIGDESGVEVFYNAAFTPWFHVTTDLQWISPIRDEFDDTWAGGIRVSIDF